jgi:hypothetical protein
MRGVQTSRVFFWCRHSDTRALAVPDTGRRPRYASQLFSIQIVIRILIGAIVALPAWHAIGCY